MHNTETDREKTAAKEATRRGWLLMRQVDVLGHYMLLDEKRTTLSLPDGKSLPPLLTLHEVEKILDTDG